MNPRLSRIIAAAVAGLCIAAVGAWADKDWKEVADPDALMIDETFELGDHPRLHVDVSDIDIELRQHEGNTASVKVYADARNADRAREYFEDLHLKVVKDDNTVKVQTARSMFRMSAPWNWSSRVRVHATITVPRGTDMRVKTGDGDIRSTRLVGKLDAGSSDGNITIEEAVGPSVRLHSSDGDIDVRVVDAESVDIESTDGNIHLGEARGGEIDVSSSDGDIVVSAVSAGEVYVSTSDGDLTVEKLDARSMRGRSSDGDIDVTIVGPVALDLRTSDGDIRIGAPRGIAADILLKGDRVRLAGDIEIDGELSDNRASGRIGGGGLEISARASDGTVWLEQRP